MTADQMIVQAKLLGTAIDKSVDEFLAARNVRLSEEARQIHDLRYQAANIRLRVILKEGEEAHG